MTLTNTNETTGIRYGVISGNSLDPELLDDLYMLASAKVSEQMEQERRSSLTKDIQDFLFYDCNVPDTDYAHEVIGNLVEFTVSHEFDSGVNSTDEPSARIEYEGCKLDFSYFGGAPLIFVLEGPVVVLAASLCSPCVPNAGDLDSGFCDPNESGYGYTCYGVPKGWLREETA